MTLEDCLQYQQFLRDLLKLLIKENRCLESDEKVYFYPALAKGLLGQGIRNQLSFCHNHGLFKFESLQAFALRLSDLETSLVYLRTTTPHTIEIEVPISFLWEILYTKMIYFFPLSCREAIKISGESIDRIEQGTFEFKSAGDLHVR